MESFTLEKECSQKECSNKKKPHSKSATKEKSDLSHSTVKQNEHKPQEIINAVLAADETKSQRSEIPNSVALNLNATKNES